jgi:hypothetical protein
MRRDQEIGRAVAAYKAAVTYADRSDTSGGSPGVSSGGLGESVSSPNPVIGDVIAADLRSPRPSIPKRTSIDEYQLAELLLLIDWIESDQRLRTDQELADEMIKAIGFKRRGARIDEATRKAEDQIHCNALAT